MLSPHGKLHTFYDQALRNPELLCMSCARTAWNRAACRCSEKRKQECLYFARDMMVELARPPKRERPTASGAIGAVG